VSKRALYRTELYQQLYRPIGGEYLLASSLSASGSTMIGTGLFRTHRDFSPRDRAMLQRFSPHLAAARANASSRSLLSLLTTLLADEGRAFILLGRDGSIHHTTTQAQRLLHVFFDDAIPADSSSLPHTLRNWLRLHTQNTDTPPKPLRPLIAKRDGKELRVTLTTSNNPTMPHLLELEQPAGTPDPATLRNLGLSRRQSQVLALITTGATNNEIAQRLDVSPRTVKKHLEHIYNQLGVRTRTAATTIALQTRRQ
jgi:DNA-binding CsgD family transcriptional regulator